MLLFDLFLNEIFFVKVKASTGVQELFLVAIAHDYSWSITFKLVTVWLHLDSIFALLHFGSLLFGFPEFQSPLAIGFDAVHLLLSQLGLCGSLLVALVWLFLVRFL